MNIDTEKLAVLIALINKTASYAAPTDEEFDVYDFSGGNTDDAFRLGKTEGEVNFARELMAILK